MRRLILLAVWMSVSMTGHAQAPGSPPAANTSLTSAQLQQKVVAQVRRLFALGPSFTVTAAEPKETPLSSLVQVNVDIAIEGQTETVTFYVSKDGRFIIRGDVIDTTSDPFEANRKLLKLAGSPSKGPQNAPVTVVMFSDFQCPTCRALNNLLRAMLPQYPNVRFVYKDFPLTQIHPWAMTAHVAARCAFQQKPEAFWKLHDLTYDSQESINASNVWDTMLDYAAQAGLDRDALRLCMAAPETKAAIEATQKEGLALRIANTPTIFVNGRRLVGADQQTLEQFINYELEATKRPRQ